MTNSGKPNRWGLYLVVLTVLVSVLFGFMLGNRPLSVPDEGRYAEIPREMAATGDYLTPRLNGVKYFEKPPLFYWLEAFSIRLFGLNEWALRLWPALFALFGCLAVYFAGSRMFGHRAGLLSAGVLATSLLYYALSRLITLDMPVSVLLTASLLAFLLGTREHEGWSRRLFFYGFYAFAALATLTKGLIGVVIPAMLIGTWMLTMNEWRILRNMHLLSGVALFLLIAAPWHILMAKVHPEFLSFYFIREHFQRYLTSVHHHYKPFWFFIPILFFGLFPWSAFLVQTVRHSLPSSWKDRAQHAETIFLILWAGLVFLFFSASSSKLIPYILPVLPPLAILIGNYLSGAWERTAMPGFRSGVTVFAILSILMGMGIILLPRFRPEASPRELRPVLYFIVCLPLGGTIAALVNRGKRAARHAITAIAITAVMFFLTAGALFPALDNHSVKPLALALKSRLQPGDEVASYRTYYQDLPVYLERRITVVGWTGEMEFGTKTEDVSGWMVNEAGFWKRWEGPATVYMMTANKTFDRLRQKPGRMFFLIAQNETNLILSNKLIEP